MVLFNNIFIPVLVTMVIDVDCFQPIFISPSDITSTYSIQDYNCIALGLNATCPQYSSLTSSVSFTPPFIYSDQCSSAILTNYVPIYVLLFSITGLILPSFQFLVGQYFQHLASLNEWGHFEVILRNLRIFKILTMDTVCRMVLPIRSKAELEDIVSSSKATGNGRFYNVRRLTITYVTYVFLLLTFGMGYPPLAALILVSSAMQTLVLQLCVRSHYLQVQHDESLYVVWNQVLEHEVRDISAILSGSKALSFVMSSLFVSFFIVDMTINVNISYTIALPIILMTITAFVCNWKCEVDHNINVLSLTTDDLILSPSKEFYPEQDNAGNGMELRPSGSISNRSAGVPNSKSIDAAYSSQNPMQMQDAI